MTRFWLSFVRDSVFTGACIVEAVDLQSAITRAWDLGINPGGEVASVSLLESDIVHPSWMNTLLDKKTIKANDTKQGWATPRPNLTPTPYTY